MKIAIIGNAGSGKSTLSLTLHKKVGLPLYHLDQYYWKPGWQEPHYDRYEKIHNQLCNQKEWIIEGMNTRILEYRIQKSDVIVFLDASRYLCFYRVLKRAFVNFGKEHFSSAQGCPEKGPDLKFLKFIWNFKHKQKKRIERLLKKYKDTKKIIIISNKKELENFVDAIG